MTDGADHPSHETLRLFVTGRLDEATSKWVERHLEECEQCTDDLSKLTTDDALVGELIIAFNTSDEALGESPAASWHSETEIVNASTPGQVVSPTVNDQSLPEAIGKYRLVHEIGRGGMGVVYRALDSELKREVALKVILSGELSSGAVRNRFRREAETLAQVDHPGIVKIFEVGQFRDCPFLALELISGRNLGQYTRYKAQPIDWSVAIVHQLAVAMQAAHERSIVHRDLKPGNVLVMEESVSNSGNGDIRVPTVKITDFGLAKQLDSSTQLTQSGQAMGTPSYMAPEQAAGQRNIGPATDIYALGAILYELLTGRPPHQAEETPLLLIAVIEEEPDSPRTSRGEIPRDVETITMRCLAKDPSKRYASAQDLAEDLTLFLSGEPIRAERPGLVHRLTQWARRHPQLAISYTTCVLIYALHLFARFVLELPFHKDTLAPIAPVVFVAWAVLTTLFDSSFVRNLSIPLGPFLFLGVSTVSISFVFSLDNGPQSGPVAVYFVLISGSVLVLPQARIIWFTTLLSCVCYTSLAAYAHYATHVGEVTLEQLFGFLICLLIQGACMHLIIRRADKRRRDSGLSSTMK